MDDPNYWQTVHDKVTGKNTVLTNEELDMIQRIQRAEFPQANYDPYEVIMEEISFLVQSCKHGCFMKFLKHIYEHVSIHFVLIYPPPPPPPLQ